jgi:hypothetical protein
VTETIVVPRRYRGPTRSGNGGITCGLVAALVGGVAEVTLRVPPPLDTPLEVERLDGRVVVRDGDTVVAEAEPAEVDVEPPQVSWTEAESAGARTTAFDEHAFPECFVCGPAREPGDGLRIFPGPVAPGLVATTWVARDVAPEVVWGVIDCIGAFAGGGAARGDVVLGRMAARIDRLPQDGERCVVVGWWLGEDGRKVFAGTGLLGRDGEPLAAARQVWIAPR